MKYSKQSTPGEMNDSLARVATPSHARATRVSRATLVERIRASTRGVHDGGQRSQSNGDRSIEKGYVGFEHITQRRRLVFVFVVQH
jgi:hypothetical protein